MNPAPLLHGSMGNLDELLMCGVGLAVVLVFLFLSSVRGNRGATEPEKGEEKVEHETQ